MPPAVYTQIGSAVPDASRSKKLQLLGVLCGFAAGAWLGAAEAPTKLVSIGISPMVISLIMVIGVFLARWSLPALILGTSSVRADVRRAPHLIIWALLAGCLWAVANTLTIFAIRDIGLSIAFPLWNSNSLLGILWGFLFFNELRQVGWRSSLKKRNPQRMPRRLLEFHKGKAMLRPMSRMAKIVSVLATAQRHPASRAQITR